MKKKLKQLLALVLTLAVVMGFALPAAAADPGPRVTIEKVSNDAVTAEPEMHTAETKEDTPQYADTDMVRVSITLAGASTIDAGYATRSIANNAAADIYRTGLKVQQQAMAQRISQDVLGGEALDVVWNMTLLTNTISANVPYGKIEAIEALDGVALQPVNHFFQMFQCLSPAGNIPERIVQIFLSRRRIGPVDPAKDLVHSQIVPCDIIQLLLFLMPFQIAAQSCKPLQ